MSETAAERQTGAWWASAALTLDQPRSGISGVQDAQRISGLVREAESQVIEYFKFRDELAEVRRNYVLPADPSAALFLERNASMARLLCDAAMYLRNFFGATVVFRLKAPVDDAGDRSLCAVVMWPGSACEARQALDQFDEEWWIARTPLAHGHLTFTYELV